MKKGQGTVEFVLLIVVLIPIILSIINWLRLNVVAKLNTSLKSELACNIRYGYSCAELEDKAEVKYELMPNVTGEPAYMYLDNTDTRHPLAFVERGW